MEDRQWMYTGRRSRGEMTAEWMGKSERFLNVAFAEGQDKAYCPCSVCQNYRKSTRLNMGKHLQNNGFMPNYSRWTFHGESDPTREEVVRQCTHNRDTGITDMLHDYHAAHETSPPTEEEPEESAKAYYDMLASAQKPLHEHTKVCQLDAIGQLMALKTEFGLSREGFDRMVIVIGGFLPGGHIMPKNMYESKKILRALKMPYEEIHACTNGCVLFRKEYEFEECCPECNSSRYVEAENSDGKPKKKIPVNVLRYLPVIQRIQRLYMSEETAKQMRWHKDGIRYKKDDRGKEMMVHPSDGDAWKDFDLHNSHKAAEARNVRISIATDGFNPFGMSANSYSCWPMFVIPLNLPPGVIMQRKYIFLSLIIPGPKHPGKNMSVYMQPLMDDLKEAWVNGVRTWDRATQTNFTMHVWYQFSLHDLPAYAIFTGWCVHGKFPCPRCKAAMRFLWLNAGRKYVCFDLHRQFLDPHHPFRQDKVNFTKDIAIEHLAPPEMTGLQIREQLDALEPDPKRPGYYLGYGEEHAWTHKPCFWDLPYFEQLKLPHNIDVMHTEKNIGEAIFGTMFDIAEKTKDNIKARVDQEMLCDRTKLNMQPPKGGKNWRKPKADFVLTRDQRREILLWFKTLMFPDGYAANLKRGVNLDTLRINGMKSHDWHIWLERILPVMIRGYIPEEDWLVLAELSYFFRILCAKELSLKVVEDMEKLAPVLLCKLERIFPPGFFVPMQHMILHLPSEARLGGTVHPRWCYGPERMQKTLRAKCKNKARVEASIAEAYLHEEVTNFTTSYYNENIPTLHNPVSRYNIGDPERESKLSLFKGQLGPAGASGSKKLSREEWRTITLYIFTNLEEMRVYIDQFVEQFWTHAEPPDDVQEYELLVDRDFSSWIHQRAIDDPSMRDDLRDVANGFDFKVGTFEKYDINGYRFHTTEHERTRPDRKTTNTGVFTMCGGLEYYGRVEEIYELGFFGSNPPKVVIFKCHWFDPNKIRRHNKIGLVEIQRDTKLECPDVYIVAQQATQVYYLSYPCTSKKALKLQGWDVVYKVSPRGRAPAPNKEDYHPHIDLDTHDDQLFQEEHGLTGRFEINLPLVEDMEIDNDSDGDDVEEEEEEVADPDDLSMLENLRLDCGAYADGPPPDDIIYDDTPNSDDEAPTDPENDSDDPDRS